VTLEKARTVYAVVIEASNGDFKLDESLTRELRREKE